MSKANKHKNATKQTAPQRPWWLWAVAAAAVILVVGGLTVLLTANNSGSGVPKVAVDRTEIDEGYQKLNSTIRTSFTLRNEGDGPLQILGEPEVKLVEGC